MLLEPAENRPSATDFNVVGVRTQAQDLARRILSDREKFRFSKRDDFPIGSRTRQTVPICPQSSLR